MMARTSLEIIAPSVDEAIAKGLSDLGLNRDQVEVEILDTGTRGLFGIGSRQSRVRLTVLEPSAGTQKPKPAQAQAGTSQAGADKPGPGKAGSG